MKVQKNKWKKVLSLLLAGVLTVSSLNYSGLSVAATEADSEEFLEVSGTGLIENTESVSEKTEASEIQEETSEVLETPEKEIFYVEEEYIPMDEIQTSAIGMSFFSTTPSVEMKGTNEVQWIDRIAIPTGMETDVKALYNALAEGSDNDGEADILIDDSYFNLTQHSIEVVSVTGDAESQEAMEADISEIFAEYSQYITAAYNAFDRDHPEVFWLSGSSWVGSSYSYYSSTWEYTLTISVILKGTVSVNGSPQAVDVRVADYQSQSSIESAISTRDSRISTILNGFTGSSTYEKLQYFNKTLTTTNEYNTSSDLNTIAHECRECTSALSGSTGTAGPVCEAYARAFKVLCDKSAIPCVLVDGRAKNSTSSEGEAHMWNYVQLDNEWYAVDVTWNDPVVSGVSGAVSGYESEKWFLAGSETVIDEMSFITSHPVSNQVSTSGPAFTNGPVLSTIAYEKPVEALPTTLTVKVIDESETEQTAVAYGDKILIEVTAGSGDSFADVNTESFELYHGDKKIENAALEAFGQGAFRITYDTLAKELPAGLCELTVKFSGGTANDGSVLAEAAQTVSVTINPVQPEVSFTETNKTVTYTGKEPVITTPTVALLSNDTAGTISYQYQSADSSDWAEGLPVNVGTYTVKAVVSASADGYYSQAESENTVALTIEKSTPVITIDSDWKTTKVYDGKPFAVPTEEDVTITGAAYEDIKFVWHKGESADQISEDTEVEAIARAGKYVLLAEIPASANTEEVIVTKEITITKCPVTITALEQQIAYGGEIQSSPESVTADGLAEGDEITGVVLIASTDQVTENGNVSISDIVIRSVFDDTEDAAQDYEITKVSGKLVITPAEMKGISVVLAIPEGGFVYDGTEQQPAVSVTTDSQTLTEGTDYTLSYSDNVNAGDATIAVTGIGNYAGTVKKTFSIQKRPVTVTEGDYKVSKVYDGTNEGVTVTGSVKAEGILETDTVTIKETPEVFTNINAGMQSELAVNLVLSGDAADNYELSETSILVPCEITKRPVTVRADALSKTYGEDDPVFTYTTEEDLPETAEALSGQLTRETGENAGSYSILQGTLTNENNPNYEITYTAADFTIEKAEYTVNLLEDQTVVYEVGGFAEPEFVAGTNKVEGTLTYSYDNQEGLSYAEVAARLKALQKDASGIISYTFVPADANYTGETAGSFAFTIKDIEFTVNGNAASAENAVTVKENPVYGDTWEEILSLNKITASVGTTEDSNASHFTVDVTGSPNAGAHTFNIYYNGTILGKTYSNVLVCTGTVEVGKRELTVTAGSAKVTKEYDGTKTAGVLSGSLKIDGILTNDDITVTALPAAFTDANAGIRTSVTATLSLEGNAKDNYVLESTEISIPCEITKKPITVKADALSKTYGEADPNFTYTVTETTPLVTGEVLEGVLAREDGENAGTYQMTVGTLPEQNKNYEITFESAVFTIEKAVYTGEKSGKASVIYGNEGSFDAASILPEGAKLGQPGTADDTILLKDSLTVKGTVLTWKVADNQALVGKTAELTLPVAESTNYLPYDITITVTVLEKQKQEGFAFRMAVVEKVYGDAEFAVVPTGAAKDSKLTYTSSDEKLAKVDANGKVQILGAGSVTITASASETAAYLPAETSYTLNIAKKLLTWDVSELSALDREDGIENNQATLTGKLMVTGILDADKKDVTYNCPADVLTGIYKETTPGTQTVLLLWAKLNGAPVLEGEKAGNYALPTILPDITGKINEVHDDFKFELSGTDNTLHRLVAEEGISWDSVGDGEWYHSYDTPEKIENFMYERIQLQTADISKDRVIVYDIELQRYKAGEGWRAVTKEEFPKDGLAIEVPYPEGTGKDTHDFTVSHVFTDDMNGYKAGDVENPAVTKTDTGVRFTVNGLSPIAIGWKEIVPETTPDADTGGNGNAESDSSNSGGGSWYYDPEIDGKQEEDNAITGTGNSTGNKNPVKNPDKTETSVDMETDGTEEDAEESTEVIEDTQEIEQEVSESTEAASETENAEKSEDMETGSDVDSEGGNGFIWFIAFIILLLAVVGVIFVNKKNIKK